MYESYNYDPERARRIKRYRIIVMCGLALTAISIIAGIVYLDRRNLLYSDDYRAILPFMKDKAISEPDPETGEMAPRNIYSNWRS